MVYGAAWRRGGSEAIPFGIMSGGWRSAAYEGDPAILYARDLVKAGYICGVFTADLNIVAQAMRSPEPRD
jgi:hypothetical protein